MKHSLYSKLSAFNLSLLFLLTLMFSGNLWAGDHVITQVASGDAIKTASLKVVDQFFGKPGNFKTPGKRVVVSLLHDNTEAILYTSAWTLEVNYTVTLKFPDGTQQVKTGILTLQGSPLEDVEDLNIHQIIYDGVNYAEVEVTSYSFTDASGSISNIPDDFHLEVSVEVERYFDLVSTAPVIRATNYSASTNQLELGWDFIKGAEEFELEFVFVADGEAVGNHQSQPFSYDFRNATRIQLPGNFYAVSMAYPKGSLIYRVRGVGYDVNQTDYKNHKVYTDWSYNPTPANRNIAQAVADDAGSECYYYFTGIDGNKNWTYTTTFAENGKHKEVASYADGSGRTRQQITINNTDNNAIIAETVYDHVGRPAVQILPGVTTSQGIKYYGSLLNPVNGDWDRDNFATDNHLNESNDTLPEPLPATAVTAKYYSSANDIDGVNIGALPDANGYAYILTQYKNDGTDRPVVQSGVGQELRYKANGGHNTRYFYAAPTQSELDRLFGNEAGHAQFYRKNLVIDPNGQQSVQYLDNSGRVIATALGGANPANLDTIGDKNSDSIATPLFNGPGELPVDGELTGSFDFVCSSPQELRIDYSLDTDAFLEVCRALSSQNLKYDISIEVHNSNGQLVVDTFLTGVDALSSTSILSWNAGIGTYTITRTVQINEAARQSFLTSMGNTVETSKDNPGPCGPYYTLSADTVCPPLNCDSACFRSYTFTENGEFFYLDTAGAVYAESSSTPGEYYNTSEGGSISWSVSNPEAPFNIAINLCVQECEDTTGGADTYQFFAEDRCQMKLQSMLIDVSPGGTYMDYSCDSLYCIDLHNSGLTGTYDSIVLRSSPGNVVLFTDYEASVTNGVWCMATDLTGVGATGSIFNVYEGGTSVWSDDFNGTTTLTWTCDSSQHTLSPGDLQAAAAALGLTGVSSWLDVYEQWEEGFENTLLQYHPEYCAYSFFCGYEETCPGQGTLIMQAIRSYQGLMYLPETYSGSKAYQYNSVTWNLMNPLGFTNTASNGHMADNTDYISEGTPGATDPLATGCNQENTDSLSGYANYHLTQLLQQFIPVVAEWGEPLGYYSLWYLLDDPDGIAEGNGGNNHQLDTTIIKLFNTFHGDGTACGEPLISSDEDKRFYFISIYTFLREKVMYDYFKNIYTCPSTSTPYTYWDGDTNYDGILDDGSGITLNYPRNLVYEYYDDPTDMDLNQIVQDQADSIDGDISYPEIDSCSCSNFITFLDDRGLGSAPSATIADELNNFYCESLTATDVDSLRLCENANYRHFVILLPADLKCNASDYYLQNATEDCSDNLKRLAYEHADQKWAEDKAAYLDSLGAAYDHYAFANFSEYEDATLNYDLGEYHYTLYYYDLAGNLVKTIPPAGVNTLSANEIFTVQNFRAGTGNMILPEHSHVTNYQYNTQNQVKQQNTPDGGSTRFWYDNKARLVASQNDMQADSGRYSYSLYDGLGRIVEAGQLEPSTTLEDTVAASPAQFENWIKSGPRDQVNFTLYDVPLYQVPGTGTDEDEIEDRFGPGGQRYLRNRVATTLYIPSIATGNVYVFDNNTAGSIPSDYLDYESATHYSYDPHGNVDALVQDIPDATLIAKGRRFFKMLYEYDLVSGNVTQVRYQPGRTDQWHHRSHYDADNRIVSAETSRDDRQWDEDARYYYYPHGPLSRMELGDMTVQGLDYAYTIQGWLKSVNGSSLGVDTLPGVFDLGSDGTPDDNLNRVFASDAFGFHLSYFDNDYTPITAHASNPVINTGGNPLMTDYNSLYNGNISRMMTVISDNVQDPADVLLNNYKYDQLNRISRYRSYREDDLNRYNTSSSGASAGYGADYYYDPNGNLMTLSRTNASDASMDSLIYHYDDAGSVKKNRLLYVDDLKGVVNATDLDDQASGNYTYDVLGNLISDFKEGITSIKWNLQNKIDTINKTGNEQIYFQYDALGNRIRKTVDDGSTVVTTWYIRDAQGNIMATYKVQGGVLTLEELNLYGSDRLGLTEQDVVITDEVQQLTNGTTGLTQDALYELEPTGTTTINTEGPTWVGTLTPLYEPLVFTLPVGMDILDGIYSLNGSQVTVGVGKPVTLSYNGAFTVPSTPGFALLPHNSYIYLDNYTGSLLQVDEGESSRETGKKRYELKNHLGNVLSVITDKKYVDEVEDIPTVTDKVGILVSEDKVKRTAAGSSWGTSGGASMEYIYGDGYVSRTLENTLADNQRIVVGLSYENADAHYNKIDYGLFTKIDHTFIVWESGAAEYQGGTWEVGDVLKVAREGNEIKYYQNDNVLRTVTEDPSNEGEPLLVDFAMYDEGTSIYKLRIGNNGYVANVTSAQDYYPFGSIMPGRNYNAGDHRYGFGGHEKDNEVSGNGNSYTTHWRQYDPRIGRWKSIDPKFKKYPDLSPYSYAANSPMIMIDAQGDTIILVGTAAEQQAALAHLQKLTNDKLGLRGNMVIISKLGGENPGTDLKYGTNLIRKLNRKGHSGDKKVEISIGAPGSGNSASADNWTNAQNGTGSNGTVNFDLTSNPPIKTEDPVTGDVSPQTGRPNEIGLGHELIHILHIFNGDVDLTLDTYTYQTKAAVPATDATPAVPAITVTQPVKSEELRTVGLKGNKKGDITENDLRKEQGQNARGAY